MVGTGASLRVLVMDSLPLVACKLGHDRSCLRAQSSSSSEKAGGFQEDETGLLSIGVVLWQRDVRVDKERAERAA